MSKNHFRSTSSTPSLGLSKLPKRRTSPKLVTELKEKSLASSLTNLRWDPYYTGIPKPEDPPNFNHKARKGIFIRGREKYKKLSEEEIRKCKEFSKNFVFSGDEFLYVNVKNPKFNYKEFAKRMKETEIKVRDIKRKARNMNKSIIGFRIQTRLQKMKLLKAFGFDDSQRAKTMREENEKLKEDIDDYVYKRDKINVENDHVSKANKIISENSRLIKENINRIQYLLKKSEEFKISVSKEKLNYFNRVNSLLLNQQLDNYEEILDECIKLGEFVKKFNTKAVKYVAKPFKLSYVEATHQNKARLKKYSNFGVEKLKKQEKKDYNFNILQESDGKMGMMINEIFAEMQNDKKIPRYIKKNCPRLEKLKAIRDYYQHLNTR